MSKDKGLLVKKETFLSKIKRFLENLFFEEVEEVIEDEEKLEKKSDKKDDFIKDMKVEEDPEKIRLLKLQDMIRDRQIDEDDISNEDVIKLRGLYEEQIENLKTLIESHKKEINAIKDRIEAN